MVTFPSFYLHHHQVDHTIRCIYENWNDATAINYVSISHSHYTNFISNRRREWKKASEQRKKNHSRWIERKRKIDPTPVRPYNIYNSQIRLIDIFFTRTHNSITKEWKMFQGGWCSPKRQQSPWSCINPWIIHVNYYFALVLNDWFFSYLPIVFIILYIGIWYFAGHSWYVFHFYSIQLRRNHMFAESCWNYEISHME